MSFLTPEVINVLFAVGGAVLTWFWNRRNAPAPQPSPAPGPSPSPGPAPAPDAPERPILNAILQAVLAALAKRQQAQAQEVMREAMPHLAEPKQ